MMTIEMMLDPFPTDLVAEHSARMPPPEGERGTTFPLYAPIVESREGSCGAPPDSCPLLTRILWSALSMAYISFDHNMHCSDHLVTDKPALAAICLH